MESIDNIRYNPKLSIEQNAKLNGLSGKSGEERIRYYIRANGIDRRHAKQVVIVNAIRKYLKKHPDATKLGASKDLPYGINTIRKYWNIAKTDGVVEQNPNKASKRERLAQEQERKRIEFLDSLSIEYIKEYLIRRESSISVAPIKIDQVVDATGSSQYKILVLDFDMTLFNTAIDRDDRMNRDWKAVYKRIPNYTLYQGWREVFKHCQESDIKVIIISQAKGELIKRTLKYFDLQYDIVIGGGLWGYPKKTSKNSGKLIDIALKSIGCEGIDRCQIISVGDSITDRNMSENAGIAFYGAIWDCEKADSLPELLKGKTITKPIQIIDILEGV